ncbi:MAG: RsmD family RNA methyltransferase [Planctomycetaceae bacterium]|nr:RsmD family RNA methyltransferase [Planctomycetaceae bacterium]
MSNKSKSSQTGKGKPVSGRKKAARNVGSQPGEKEPLGLRVIGGRLRGSKLLYSGDNRVRPMKDRTREAVFNLINVAVNGKHVIDLFAGTGALAVEALSRGAKSASIIEVHLATMRNLRQNIEAFQLDEKCCLIQADAFYLAKRQNELFVPAGIPWLVFCSPPYEFYVSKQKEMLEMLKSLYDGAPDGSVFVIESDHRFDFDLLQLSDENDLRRRSYPPAEIGIYRKDCP